MKRLPLLAAVTATGLVGLVAAGSASAADPKAMHVPVDGQAYVATVQTDNPSDGTAVDVYGGDQSVIHVAMNAGQEQARSFVHVALDYLPARAAADQVALTLHVAEKSDASTKGVYNLYNVNAAAAIIQACVLSTPFDAALDRAAPPAADCAAGSAVGKVDKAGTTWTFRLGALLPAWKRAGNTGLALVPIAADPTATWGVAFAKTKSTAKVVYRLAADRTGTRDPLPAVDLPGNGAGTGAGAGTDNGPVAEPGAAAGVPVPAAGPVTTPAPAATQPPMLAPTGGTVAVNNAASTAPADGPRTWWPWVLLASILVAGGAIAVAHRVAVLAWLAKVVPPGVAAFRTHPRAYSVASAALAWGLVFTSYSLITTTDAGTQPLAGATPAAGVPGSALPTPTGSSSPVAVPSGAGGGGQPLPGATSGAGGATVGGGGQPTPSRSAVDEFSGRGHYETISGIPVFFPADGGPPVAKLYSGADDVAGLTADSLRVCAHAALTYGAAFNIGADDLDVYWQEVNSHGGIFGRKVVTNYQNDNYDPGTAVTAAQACKDWGTFLLLGGIGFDQIPAVRQWAEQNRMLYMYHAASMAGSQGLRYSFTSLPSVEQLGTWFGQLAIEKFRDKKVGIIYRDSTNWRPGYELFKRTIEAAGMEIVGEAGTQVNQGNYTQEIARLNTAGAQVVFAWENALAATEMIKQAQAQAYHPTWLLFPFNLTTNTIDADHSATQQDIWGIAAWDAYDPGYYGGGFAPYAAEIKEFERQYAKWDPQADLGGPGGDLLFLNWEAQKGLHALFEACGKDCTRNKIAGLLLAGWHKPVPPNCPVDFRRGDRHHGGYTFNVFHMVRDPNGRANFVPTRRCVTGI
jgi:ABC-type branched-subunit amino acid transport system substrate-binding protein